MTPRYRTILALLLALWGGFSLGCDASKTTDKLLEPFFPPSPGQVAREAFTVYDADKRRRAVTLLSSAKFGGEDAYLRMYRLLIDDPDATVRAACAKALGEHGTHDDALLIIPRLSDETAFVRWEAAQALQKIHHEKAAEPLMTVTAKDEDNDVRLAAAYALGQYPEVPVFNVLVGALNDTDFSVVEMARESLTTITGQDLGSDASAWLAWSGQNEGKLFASAQPYVWHPYNRKPGFVEKAKFWKSREAVEPQPARGVETATPATPAPPQS
ncbi:MAG: HEAT repeat domain-containing protein [Planctomycetes bacterium]|nr:HEAT repeat domain-containing protein [Planctomycetota bacterium]